MRIIFEPMTAAEKLYLEIGQSLAGAEQSQMFGKPCLKKADGKAFACLFEDCMVFKLEGDIHAKAISLDGSQLFDPSKKGRPMKAWVQVPYAYHRQWSEFAQAALAAKG